jgi:hypothetical protein
MKKRNLTLALPLLALVACSTDKVSVASADTALISVGATQGVPDVDLPMLTVGRGVLKFQWAVNTSSHTGGYFFRKGGIAGDSSKTAAPAACGKVGKFDDAFTCTPPSFFTGKSITCERKQGVYEPDTCYKYAVTLTKNGNTTLDPWIKNEP